jgi:uncharacterized protein YbaP (TraB family)
MISVRSLKKSVRIQLLVVLLIPSFNCGAQENDNSLFWEISGKKLTKPSYLFGTFHLMGSSYVDSLTNLLAKFNACDQLVSELIIDSTMTTKMMTAAQMKGTTLETLLDSVMYSETDRWLKELSAIDLSMLNSLNPVTVQLFITTLLQQKYFPTAPGGEVLMDSYFQQMAVRNIKKSIGLESFETQLHALYGQFSLTRQVEMLSAFVRDRENVTSELINMNRIYRNEDLHELTSLLTEETYTPGEIETLLDKRNKKWMEKLPGIMRSRQTFIAVGALHLPGPNGLVELLRKAGYVVRPIATRG